MCGGLIGIRLTVTHKHLIFPLIRAISFHILACKVFAHPECWKFDNGEVRNENKQRKINLKSKQDTWPTKFIQEQLKKNRSQMSRKRKPQVITRWVAVTGTKSRGWQEKMMCVDRCWKKNLFPFTFSRRIWFNN